MTEKIEHRVVWAKDGIRWHAKCGICGWDGPLNYSNSDAVIDLRSHVAGHDAPKNDDEVQRIFVVSHKYNAYDLAAYQTREIAQRVADRYNSVFSPGTYDVIPVELWPESVVIG